MTCGGHYTFVLEGTAIQAYISKQINLRSYLKDSGLLNI
uniref:Uncharacterized protein n=1 Tax=Arundo donax TaxID=35708 RepID=A0A0A8YYV0_ARUDO